MSIPRQVRQSTKLFERARQMNRDAEAAAKQGLNATALMWGNRAYKTARKGLDRSLALGIQPALAEAHGFTAMLALNVGLFEEALELIDAGLKAGPSSETATRLQQIRQAAMRARIQFGREATGDGNGCTGAGTDE
jgi:hypothetical protein